MVTAISLGIGLPGVVSSEKHPYYYYLHISSCRVKNNALLVADKVRDRDYSAVTSYENVAALGHWDRVYVGPFSSLETARLKKKELLNKGYVDYAAIHRKDDLIWNGPSKLPNQDKELAYVVPVENSAVPVLETAAVESLSQDDSLTEVSVSEQPEYEPTHVEKRPAPIILDYHASKVLHPGATWKVYLHAKDNEGDMKYIAAQLWKPGTVHSVDLTMIDKEDRHEFSGYLFVNTPLDPLLVWESLNLKVLVRDSQGNRSKAIDLPLTFHLVPRQEVPEDWQAVSKNKLGTMWFDIESSEKSRDVIGG
jgi:hypothetical protein